MNTIGPTRVEVHRSLYIINNSEKHSCFFIFETPDDSVFRNIKFLHKVGTSGTRSFPYTTGPARRKAHL